MKTILEALDIIIEKQLWPEKKPSEILKILLYVYGKGWLYTPKVNGNIVAVLCAYRINNENNLTKLPSVEEGTILYVPFAVSLTGDNLFKVIRESLNVYLEHNPDIIELILEDKNNKIKRYNLKGASNGQEQGLTASSNANVSN